MMFELVFFKRVFSLKEDICIPFLYGVDTHSKNESHHLHMDGGL